MPRRVSLGLAALAAAAAAFLTYSGSLRNGFAWDDHVYIEGNPFVQEPANARRLFSARFWTTPDDPVPDAARPVFVLSLLGDRALWGGNARGYHLTNTLIHAAASALAVPVSAIVLSPPAAALAGLIFAVHPANSEAVELASFRPDLLAALFLFAALWLHWSWRRQRSGALSAAGLAGCASLYALGLLSKEMAATFPGLALALEAAAWPKGRKRRWGWLAAAMLVYGAVALVYLRWRAPRAGYEGLPAPAVARAAAARRAPAPAAPAPASPSAPTAAPDPTNSAANPELKTFPPSEPQWAAIYKDRRLNALTMTGVLGDELGLLVAGRPLHADRAPVLIRSARSPRAWGVWLLLAAAAAAAALAWRASQRLPALALAWILIAWLPVSDVIALYNPIAERYLYLLSLGAAWLLAWAVNALAARGGRAAANALAAALLMYYGAASWLRTRDWRSDETLFGREASLQAGSARVYYNLGVQARERGDLTGSEAQFRKALALNPRYVEAQTNLAALLCGRKRMGECVALLRRAVSEKPSNDVPYLALAQALTQQGRPGEALGWFRKAYEISGHLDRESAIGLARSSLAAGRAQEPALAALRGLIAAPDGDAEASGLFALISWKMGRREVASLAAAEAFSGRRESGPPGPAAYAAMARLLRGHGAAAQAADLDRLVLARDPDDKDANYQVALQQMQSGRDDLALPLLQRAAAKDSNDPLILLNLGVCYHHLGQLGPAEDALQRAVDRGGHEAPFYYNLGAAYLDDPARIPQAQDALSQATRRDPKYVDAWYNLGVALIKLGRGADALGAFERVIALKPDKIEALNNAAVLLIGQGQPAKAAQLLRQALAVSPRHPGLHNNLGEALLSERRLAEAAAEFQFAIQRTSPTPDNKADLTRYLQNLAQTYAAMGDKAQAEGALRQARLVMGAP